MSKPKTRYDSNASGKRDTAAKPGQSLTPTRAPGTMHLSKLPSGHWRIQDDATMTDWPPKSGAAPPSGEGGGAAQRGNNPTDGLVLRADGRAAASTLVLEGEHCQDCGSGYRTVYWLPDDIWAAITPKPDSPGAGLLCPPCADRRATEAGTTLYWTADASVEAS